MPAKLIFLIGINSKLGKETSLEMLREEEHFDDILFGDFDDSFHNLTMKDQMYFTWVKHGCKSAKYVFKGDDDTLINPFQIQKFLKTKNSTEPALYGCKVGGQPVIRNVSDYNFFVVNSFI